MRRRGRCLLTLTFLRSGGIRCDVGATPGSDVKRTIDMLGDGSNLRPKLLLDTVEVEAIFIRHQVDGETQMSEPAGTANTVKICFRVLGEIKVDDNIDGLNIDATSEEVGAHEVSTHAVSEVVEDAVTVRLQHFRVRVEARISEVGDLLCEQFDAVRRVAEDYRLVDLQLIRRVNEGLVTGNNHDTDLGEEGVKTVDLLTFLDESVILCDTAEGQFVH